MRGVPPTELIQEVPDVFFVELKGVATLPLCQPRAQLHWRLFLDKGDDIPEGHFAVGGARAFLPAMLVGEHEGLDFVEGLIREAILVAPGRDGRDHMDGRVLPKNPILQPT